MVSPIRKEIIFMTIPILEDYDVHQGTMAILPAKAIDYDSIVLETNQTLYIRKTPLQIIKDACLEGGSTYEGRREAVIHLTGAQNKVPIPVNPREHIYAFPTHSPQLFECQWLFYHHIRFIQPKPNTPRESIITFKNNPNPLQIEVSYNTLYKQMQRAAYCIVRYSFGHIPQWQRSYGGWN
jgi:competence protein ComK